MLKGRSQEELADRAGVDRSYMSGIERGGRNLSVPGWRESPGLFTRQSAIRLAKGQPVNSLPPGMANSIYL
jgi:DNA-binding XRE family transcriptional regulator